MKIDLTKLNVQDLNDALETSGYTDNGLLTATFVKTNKDEDDPDLQFVYRVTFWDENEGKTDATAVYVWIKSAGEKIGQAVAEFAALPESMA